MSKIAVLPARGVVEVSGEDRVAFLQGLVSNDVAQAVSGQAVWAALLTPQGKWLADFFIFADDEQLLLDCEREQAAMLVQKLSRFRLRSKVALRDVSADWSVAVGWEGAAMGDVASPDPRLAAAGWRGLFRTAPAPTATPDDYDAHRLALGLPDGARDLEADKTVLLEAGFDELHGVSWSKGCYMGQELTARTKYRGLIKKRLVAVAVSGPLPAPGTPVLRAGAEVGTMRSGLGGRGLATIRLEALDGELVCGEAVLTPEPADWMALPAQA